MADPKAPEMIEGWEIDGQHGIAWNPDAHGAKRIAVWNGAGNALQMTCDGDWPDVPLPVLRALLSAHGLHIVTEAEKRVLETRETELRLVRRLRRCGRTRPEDPMTAKRRAREPKAAKAERIKGELLELCRDFIDEQGITCAEAVHQSDRVIENAYEFIGQICELVGYHKDPDE